MAQFKYGKVQYNTVQYSTVLHITVPYNGTIQYSVV